MSLTCIQLDKAQSKPSPTEVRLSDGTTIGYERARQFMDYYCRKYGFGKPDISIEESNQPKGVKQWQAVMTVGERRIGLGSGRNKKEAQTSCYLDVTQYL